MSCHTDKELYIHSAMSLAIGVLVGMVVMMYLDNKASRCDKPVRPLTDIERRSIAIDYACSGKGKKWHGMREFCGAQVMDSDSHGEVKK